LSFQPVETGGLAELVTEREIDLTGTRADAAVPFPAAPGTQVRRVERLDAPADQTSRIDWLSAPVPVA